MVPAYWAGTYPVFVCVRVFFFSSHLVYYLRTLSFFLSFSLPIYVDVTHQIQGH